MSVFHSRWPIWFIFSVCFSGGSLIFIGVQGWVELIYHQNMLNENTVGFHLYQILKPTKLKWSRGKNRTAVTSGRVRQRLRERHEGTLWGAALYFDRGWITQVYLSNSESAHLSFLHFIVFYSKIYIYTYMWSLVNDVHTNYLAGCSFPNQPSYVQGQEEAEETGRLFQVGKWQV